MKSPLSKYLETYFKEKVVTEKHKDNSDLVQKTPLLLQKQSEKKRHLIELLEQGFDDIQAGKITTQTPREIFAEVMASRNA